METQTQPRRNLGAFSSIVPAFPLSANDQALCEEFTKSLEPEDAWISIPPRPEGQYRTPRWDRLLLEEAKLRRLDFSRNNKYCFFVYVADGPYVTQCDIFATPLSMDGESRAGTAILEKNKYTLVGAGTTITPKAKLLFLMEMGQLISMTEPPERSRYHVRLPFID